VAALFAQRRNALRPSFLRMLVDIGRFNRLGWRHLREDAAQELTVGQFLVRHGFGKGLAEWYLLPMAAAIRSAPVARLLDYPARSLLAFFANHGLLGAAARRAWRTSSAAAVPMSSACCGRSGHASGWPHPSSACAAAS
jgi:predicted NAD/FAD-binding protein